MASVEKRTRDAKVTWLARWRDPDGQQRKRTFARKLDADRYIVGIESDKLRGAYIDPEHARMLLREYAEKRWLPVQVHLRPSTLALYRAHLNNHLLPALGARPLGSLRRQDFKAFVARLSATLAPPTVGTAFAVARSVMQSAVDDGLIAANPCSRVPLPRVERRVVEPLPPASVLAVADAIAPRYRVAVLLAAGAGLREGEVLGLLLPRVDFLRRRVHVEEQLQGNGGAPVLSPLKTKASRRVVPVDDVVVQAVSRHVERWETGPGGLLITNRLGSPVRRSSFGSCWRDAVETAGLPAGTHFHSLRHFYASTLIAAGLHPKVIQTRLGHATISETMDTYGHLFPDAEDTGRGALDAVLAPAGVPQVCPEAIG